MLFGIERETRFDLRFRLFGTPIRVTPFFWVTSIFFGWSTINFGIEYLLIWVACVFFSLLLHEFGHILMGRLFGHRGEIVLQSMCGLAIGAGGQYERWKRILVSLAGPGIQILFFLFLVLTPRLFADPGPVPEFLTERQNWFDQFMTWLYWPLSTLRLERHIEMTIQFLIAINLFWAIINLFPVWPLDGGQVSREIFTKFAVRNGVRASLGLSIATAVLLAINSILSHIRGAPTIPYLPAGGIVFILLFALLAFQSFQLLQIENAKHTGHWRDPDDDRLPWESDPDEWKRR